MKSLKQCKEAHEIALLPDEEKDRHETWFKAKKNDMGCGIQHCGM